MDLHGCGVPFGGPLAWKKQLLDEVVLCFLDPLAETDVLKWRTLTWKNK
jgi:hypothetical protein